MNLYFFKLSRHGVFVAAINWRTAKRYAVSEFRMRFPGIRMADVTGFRVKENADVPEGIHDRNAVLEAGETWWTCPTCGSRDFEYINGYTGYRCGKCDREGVIPDVVPEIMRKDETIKDHL